MEGVDNLVSAMTSCTVHMEKMSREELETRFRLTEEVNEIEVELDSDSSESDDYQPPSKRVRPPTKTYAVEPWGRGKEKNAVGPRGRAHILKELSGKGKDIGSFCISCGSHDPVVAHPLFEGSLCQKCKTNFIETLYRYDKDGYQSYCTVCCWGHQVLLCSNENCYRCFCKDCLEFLVGPGTFDRMKEVEPWSCYICDPVENNGALRLRPDWSKQVQEFFDSSSNLEFEAHRIYPALPAHQRRPVKVLSLFDGMSTDHLVLKELGLQIGQHIAAQVYDTPISAGAVHDGQTSNTRDASTITRKNVAEWGPFDLLIGGSHSQNPRGTGRLFFEYYRLLTMMRPNEDDERPFFFLFQNVVAMSEHDKHDISRFLRVNPVMVDAATVSPHYFWGNLPGMSRVNRQAPQGKSRRSAAFRHLLAPLKDHFLFQLE